MHNTVYHQVTLYTINAMHYVYLQKREQEKYSTCTYIRTALHRRNPTAVEVYTTVHTNVTATTVATSVTSVVVTVL